MDRQMAKGLEALTEKEKQTLRLVLQGYDAKSMARHLDLSVHTINERLRFARRKLGVSSSREAARMLQNAECADPNSVADKLLGEAPSLPAGQSEANGKPSLTLGWIIGGLVIMSLIAAALALSALSQPTGASPATADARSQMASPSQLEINQAIVQSARDWLALVDQGNWSASWEATGQQFRELNTSDAWASASVDVRSPLGAVEARVMIEQDYVHYVPAPPHGYAMVRFRTNFANQDDTTETLTLVREDGAWKVVAYLIG